MKINVYKWNCTRYYIISIKHQGNTMTERTENIRVHFTLTKIDSGWYHMTTDVTSTDWDDNYWVHTDEMLPIRDFGKFGDLEFAVYDYRR